MYEKDFFGQSHEEKKYCRIKVGSISYGRATTFSAIPYFHKEE
jgi:hypothetical protein